MWGIKLESKALDSGAFFYFFLRFLVVTGMLDRDNVDLGLGRKPTRPVKLGRMKKEMTRQIGRRNRPNSSP